MSRLSEIHSFFKTDKGTDHSYIDTYDELFISKQHLPVKLLEVGVLYGESLRMFDAYFTHPDTLIVGVDDFSQAGGASEVKSKVSTHPRIQIVQANSRSLDYRFEHKFDYIIDDGDHTHNGQLDTYKQLIPYLREDGVYIIEDISGNEAVSYLDRNIKTLTPDVNIEARHFYKNGRHDDVLMIIKKKI